LEEDCDELIKVISEMNLQNKQTELVMNLRSLKRASPTPFVIYGPNIGREREGGGSHKHK